MQGARYSVAKEQALTVSLEEFGLSRYEAKAYVTLISKGTVSAGELAYYAEIPRTKAYPTLLKLEKKKLVMLSRSKPIMCTAVSPEDAFDEAIHEQIDKVNAMNSLVSSLKQASEESKKARGAEERRYLHIAANSVLGQIGQMIEGSKESMLLAVDQWGLGLLSECREQLVAVARRSLDIKIIMPAGQLGSEAFKKIPDGIKIKVAETGQNCLVFDQSEVLFIDSENGMGATFSSTDILAASQTRLFNHAWRSGLKTEPVADMTKAESQEIYKMIKMVEENGLGHVLNTTATKSNGRAILGLLEKNGISLEGKTIDDVIEIIDSALRIVCSGHASLDTKNKSITVESKLNSGHSLPWAGILDEYLRRHGYKTRLAYQNNSQRGERVHIKILK